MIVIANKTYGSFKKVVEAEDRLICDGIIELPYSVIGGYQIVESSMPIINVEKQIPIQIAMWQARDVMIKYGILDDVINFINNIQDPIERKRAQSKFEFSNTVRRDDPLLNFVASQAGYTKDQIDEWFIEGDNL